MNFSKIMPLQQMSEDPMDTQTTSRANCKTAEKILRPINFLGYVVEN